MMMLIENKKSSLKDFLFLTSDWQSRLTGDESERWAVKDKQLKGKSCGNSKYS